MSEAVETAVVMLNLGGPNSLDDVEPFLFNIFADSDVVQLPLGFLWQRWFARRVARARAPESRGNYARIGGRSPILELTREQGRLLDARLGPGFRTYVSMRAWKPGADEAVEALVRDGARRVVALPCYPQRSRTTTVSSLRDLRRALRERGFSGPIHEVCCYPTAPALLDAWAERIRGALDSVPPERRAGLRVLFSAHGLPRRLVERGDPYLAQTRATVAGVMERVGDHIPHLLAFQSRATRVEWLSPSTQDALSALAQEGVRDVAVVPVSFISDHVETLYELDMLIRDHATAVGIDGYYRVPALNDSPLLVGALADLVRRALATAAPLCEWPPRTPQCPRA